MSWRSLSDALVTKPGWQLDPEPCWCFGPPQAPLFRVVVQAHGYVLRDTVTGTRIEFDGLGELLAWIELHAAQSEEDVGKARDDDGPTP